MLAESRACKKCKKQQSFNQYYKKGLVCFTCQKKSNYEFSAKIELVPVKRKCLQCDRQFFSTGNRRCNDCNDYYHDMTYGTLSNFLAT